MYKSKKNIYNYEIICLVKLTYINQFIAYTR